MLPILMYHEIAASGDHPNRLAVRRPDFEAQLAYLRAAGYATVTAGALAQAMSTGEPRLPAKTVVLTFDDGYESFHSQAMPVLEKYGFTATLFVTTGWMVDVGAPPGPAPGPMLSWGQVSEAVSTGIEIGGHSCEHPQLDQLSEAAIREELYTSKARLEDKLGIAVPGLAYPFGYSDARVRRVAREAGYAYAHAVNNRMASADADQFAMPRLTVRRATTMEAFGALVHGRTPLGLRQDRILTRGWSVVRRTRSALSAQT